MPKFSRFFPGQGVLRNLKSIAICTVAEPQTADFFNVRKAI
jgi:hypothetical protein